MGPGTSPSNVHAATTVLSSMRTGTSRARQWSCSRPLGGGGYDPG
jgi:hypothetical protein